MQGGTVFLVEPISGIERQQLDFRSFGQVGGFVNDQPAGLHSSLQCHSDQSSSVQRRTTSWLRIASSSLCSPCRRWSAKAGRSYFRVATRLLPESEEMRNRSEIREDQLGSGPRGRWFKSSRPDQNSKKFLRGFPLLATGNRCWQPPRD